MIFASELTMPDHIQNVLGLETRKSQVAIMSKSSLAVSGTLGKKISNFDLNKEKILEIAGSVMSSVTM